MSTLKKYRKYVVAAILAFAFVATDSWLGANYIQGGSIFTEAQARIGRPRTPVSVGGVARRTTRRVVRRSAIYVTTLPAACARTTVSGVVVWHCGGTYYQPYGGRYVVVYID